MHKFILNDFEKNQPKTTNRSLRWSMICLLLLISVSLVLNAQTYCTPSFPQGAQYPNGFGVIYNFSTANAVVDINNQTQQGPNGYQDFSATHQAQVTQGSSFDIIVSVNTGSGCSVSVWIDWNNDGVFSTSEQVIAAMGVKGPPGNAVNLPAVETINVPTNQTPGTYRIRAMSRFGAASPPPTDPCLEETSSLGDSEDYSVIVLSDAPSCPPVTNILKSNETISSVDIAWTIGGTETSWDVQWGTDNFNPETNTGTLVGSGTASMPNYSITDLNVDTNYQIFVRADCDSENSTWRTTSYLTSYCSSTSLWNLTGITSFTTTGGINNISNNTGVASNGYNNFTDMVVSSYPEGSIDFELYSTEVNGLAIGIWVDWNNNGIFEDEEKAYASPDYINSAEGTITVPAGQSLGDFRMRVRVDFVGVEISPGVVVVLPCDEIVFGETEDYTFRVVQPSACSSVTTLNTSDVTTTSVTVSWTAGGTETLWNVEYGVAGFSQGSGITVNGVTNPYIITGLTTGTLYDVYVQADCGSGNESTWEMTSFTTDGIFTCPSPLTPGTVTATPDSGSAGSTFDVTATGYDTGADITYTWERSEDNGTNWDVVGTANNPIYSDLIGEPAPASGMVDYRLTVSCSGNSESSASATFTVTVSRVDFDLYSFSYYPNPVNDVLHFSSNATIENVIVSNMLGQQVNANLSSDKTSLDLSNLSNGNYFVKVTIEGVSKTIKVVKH